MGRHKLTKLKPKCKDCGSIISKESYTYCRICSHKHRDYSYIKQGKDHPFYGKRTPGAFKSGIDNPKYSHGKTLKQHFCIDCGTEICWKAKRCTKCSNQLEKNPNWQGGKCFEPYAIGWTNTYKEQIRYRDDYKCQLCGRPEVECKKKLHVHHIDYNKLNIAVDNLVSLCNSCHSKTNYKRGYYEKLFKKD